MRTFTSRGIYMSIHRGVSLRRYTFAFLAVSAITLTSCADEYLSGDEGASLSIPLVVTFPAVSEGVILTESVLVANTGDSLLEILSVEVDGPQGVFSEQGLEGLRLDPGEDTLVTITYAAQSSERARGQISIVSNVVFDGTTTIVRLETSEPQNILVVSPNPLDFGRVPAGATSIESVSLLNPGNIGVAVTEVFPLDPSGEFVVVEDYLAELPRTLGPNEEWSVEIAYTPSNDNRDETPLQVEYRVDGSNRPSEEVVTMIANGASPCIAVTHEDGYYFGPSLLGETREELFTIHNCSAGDNAQPLHLDSLGLLSTPEQMSAETFGIINAPTLPAELAPGEVSTFSVTYTPTELDVSERAWLEIVSNDEGKSSLVIEITGVGSSNACPTAVANCSVRGLGEIPTNELRADTLSTIDCTSAGSVDPDGSIVGYTWTLISPESSGTRLTSADQADSSFFIDAGGTYVVSLNLVDDAGGEACTIPTVTIFACPCGDDIAVEMFWTTPRDNNRDDTGPGAGSDVDLHFLNVGRGCWNDLTWDCHWRSPMPDWGVVGNWADDASLDLNDTDGWGPENVALDTPEDAATYRVGVEYRDDGAYGPSIATVRIYVFGSIVFERSRELPADNFFWEVADIEWPSGSVAFLDRAYPTIEAASCD
jgi:hypothetical protein